MRQQAWWAVSAAALFALFIFVRPAAATEQMDICAVYTDTGRSYHVTANVMYGSELNGATNSLNYNMASRYVVIFWAQGQASVIDMGSIFMPGISNPGWDQEGRAWSISMYSPASCFP
jgi:hypothetical protein